MNDGTASAPRDRRRWALAILLAVLVLIVGAGLGYASAYQASLGGFNAIGAALIAMLLAGLAGIAVLVGFVAAILPGGRGRRIVRPALAVAGLLVAGGLLGGASVPALGLGYRPPVVLMARGEAGLNLQQPAGFAAVDAGPADCRSVPDEERVQSVTAVNLGELSGRGTLRADVGAAGSLDGGVDVGVSLWIDGADLPEGADQPFWNGSGAVVEAAPGGASGRVTFAASLGGDPLGGPIGGAWPDVMSGELRWSCGAWIDPLAEPAAPFGGQMTLVLDDPAWAGTSDARASCEVEATGSVWAVSGAVGLLGDAQLTATLDLYGDHIVGDELLLSVEVVVEPSEKGEFRPNWSGQAVVIEVAADDRSGIAEFDDLGFVPPIEGWPQRLAGTISWDCTDAAAGAADQ